MADFDGHEVVKLEEVISRKVQVYNGRLLHTVMLCKHKAAVNRHHNVNGQDSRLGHTGFNMLPKAEKDDAIIQKARSLQGVCWGDEYERMIGGMLYDVRLSVVGHSLIFVPRG